MKIYRAPITVSYFRGQRCQTPAISTKMEMQMLPGMSCRYDQELQIDINSSAAPKSWERIRVARVHPDDVEPQEIVGIIEMYELKGIILVVPEADAHPDAEILELAVMPEDFLKDYGRHYISPSRGGYFPPEARVTVTFNGKHDPPPESIPATWEDVTEKREEG